MILSLERVSIRNKGDIMTKMMHALIISQEKDCFLGNKHFTSLKAIQFYASPRLRLDKLSIHLFLPDISTVLNNNTTSMVCKGRMVMSCTEVRRKARFRSTCGDIVECVIPQQQIVKFANSLMIAPSPTLHSNNCSEKFKKYHIKRCPWPWREAFTYLWTVFVDWLKNFSH